ncbi:four helix bundle protein [bacterium]|nr:four helix bundle protein [bacterium]
MKTDNVVQEKSYAFALRIIKLYKYLVENKKEYVLAKQLLRCGTSIGANVEEAIGGQSKKDFTAKLAIAYKEARESEYWLRLLKDSGELDDKAADSVLSDCRELLKLIGSIQKTIKSQSSKIRNS